MWPSFSDFASIDPSTYFSIVLLLNRSIATRPRWSADRFLRLFIALPFPAGQCHHSYAPLHLASKPAPTCPPVLHKCD